MYSRVSEWYLLECLIKHKQLYQKLMFSFPQGRETKLIVYTVAMYNSCLFHSTWNWQLNRNKNADIETSRCIFALVNVHTT